MCNDENEFRYIIEYKIRRHGKHYFIDLIKGVFNLQEKDTNIILGHFIYCPIFTMYKLWHYRSSGPFSSMWVLLVGMYCYI